jgi:hypothetical protein
MTYPIVAERAIPLDRARWRRRPVIELPAQNANTVLVFASASGVAQYKGGSLRAAMHDAFSVAAVDVGRDRLMTVELGLPSANPADTFLVRVEFRCTVTDAAAVVRNGTADIAPAVRAYLRAGIQHLAQSYTVEQINEARWSVRSQIIAQCGIDPPQIEGVEVALASVDLVTPRQIVDFAQKMRDEQWRQEFERVKSKFTIDQARVIEDIIRRGPEAVEALAIDKGEQDTATATNRAYHTHASRDDRVIELVRLLGDHGILDRVTVDASRLIERFSEVLLAGVEVDGHHPPALETDRPESLPPAAEGDVRDDEDRLHEEGE